MAETMPLDGKRYATTEETLRDLPNGRVLRERFATKWGEDFYQAVRSTASRVSDTPPLPTLERLVRKASYEAVADALDKTNYWVDVGADRVAEAAKWTAFSKVEDHLSTKETAELALRLKGCDVEVVGDTGLKVYANGTLVGVHSFAGALEWMA